MISTQINPSWLDAQDYVDFLNLCFPGTWSLASFHWYLRRSLGGRPTDIAVRCEGGKLLAMVAVCYRQVIAPEGHSVEVGIMLAGGTLPSEQRRGHYSALMQASLDIGVARRCDALLGFVTRRNGSGRGLTRLGAYSIPSYYLSSSSRCKSSSAIARIKMRGRALDPVDESALAARAARRSSGADYVRFSYANTGDWTQQFLRRSNPVSALKPTHDTAALLERVGGIDRLQWLDCPSHRTIATIASLVDASQRAQRSFFMYTLDPLLAQACTRIGLRINHGYLKVLPVDHRKRESVKRLAMQPWRLQSGDRM
jgi:Acetyltransferase (GNAT) domain